MTFRLLHTSDWHLGQHFYGKSRAKEHQAFLTWLLAQVTEHSIDAIIVAGDIFDTGTPPSYAREMYFDFIVNLSKLNCQLVILAGNHDSVAMLGESKQLLTQLACQVVPKVSENINEQVITLINKQSQVCAVICAIPFIRPRDVMKSQAGQSASDKQQTLQDAISRHYQQLYQRAKQLAGDNVPIIATGHLTTVGVSVTESVRDIYIGSLEAFPANAFPKADYIALGHIHRPQQVAGCEHIRYCGSPIPLSFDEAKYQKKVLIAEFTSNGEQEKITPAEQPDNNSQFLQVIELAVPCFQPMRMLKTTLDDLATDLNSLIETTAVKSTEDSDDRQKIWLDIEIDSAGYLQDLTPRIEQLTQDLPVEVLLVRRSKQSRAQMPSAQKKITLNELSLTEVFQSKLEQAITDSELEQARKARLTALFEQAVEQVQQLSVGDKT